MYAKTFFLAIGLTAAVFGTILFLLLASSPPSSMPSKSTGSIFTSPMSPTPTAQQKTPEELVRELRSPDEDVRRKAARELPKFGKRAVPVLAAALQSDDYRQASLCLKALQEIGREAESAIPAIWEASRKEFINPDDAFRAVKFIEKNTGG